MLRRRAVLLAVTLLASLGLAGCSGGTPVVTVAGAGQTVHSVAVGWCSDPSDAHCRTARHKIPVLRVPAGTKLAVHVPEEVAKRAWVVLADGRLAGPVHHAVQSYKLNAPVPANVSFLLQVQTLDSRGKNLRVTGNWVFRIRSS